MYFAGLRWQSRHHLIISEFSWYISGMRSTRPWQVAQPTALATWMLSLKETKAGRLWPGVHSSGGFSRKLARTGSRIGALVQICEWQFMQGFVGGVFAKADSSTVVWQ